MSFWELTGPTGFLREKADLLIHDYFMPTCSCNLQKGSFTVIGLNWNQEYFNRLQI